MNVCVDKQTIADVVSAWTGIPAGRMLEGETGKLLRMEEALGRRLVGQTQAVVAVSRLGITLALVLDRWYMLMMGLFSPVMMLGSYLQGRKQGKLTYRQQLADYNPGQDDAPASPNQVSAGGRSNRRGRRQKRVTVGGDTSACAAPIA